MSYLVLARKLRPKTFHDIIGQDHISKTLITAIKTDRVAHAFLFTGPRGTGKTSCARVLTKALNCLTPIDNEPCNECENCLEINKGIATDVLEIDAASNRGIEHIRELREGVKFSPAKCRYKTYIIDEVHMLTTESFNALLKTLEEPPAHVKFILATTDHHKVPITVISRCQRYDFLNIASHTMVQYLKKVAASETLKISESALMLIANHSAGGMRDALTTLDMLIGHSGKEIQDDDVVEILGLNNSKEVDDLLYFIVEKNLSGALNHFHSITAKGRSLTQLITDLLRAVKDLSLVSSLKVDEIHWHQFLPDQYEKYQYLSKLITPATLQQFFQILLDVETQIKRSSQAKICAEMGIIKLCGVDSVAGVAEVISLLKNFSEPPKKKAHKPEDLINKAAKQFHSTPQVSPDFEKLNSSQLQVNISERATSEASPIKSPAEVESLQQESIKIKNPVVNPTKDKDRQEIAKSIKNETDEKTVSEPETIHKYNKSTSFDSNANNVTNEPDNVEHSSIDQTQQIHSEGEPDKPADRDNMGDAPPNLADNEEPEEHFQSIPQESIEDKSSETISSDKPSNDSVAGKWRQFVDNVGTGGNKSLLSLLRNSVILELTDNKLVIGYKNIQIFSPDKKKEIADVARNFFNNDIKVYYKEQDKGLATSLKKQKDAEIIKQKEEIKAKAASNPRVIKALEIFPGSEIKKITIMEDKNND